MNNIGVGRVRAARILMVLCASLITATIPCGTAQSQISAPVDSVLRYLRRPIHGIVDITDAERKRVQADQELLRSFASLLDGTISIQAKWDTAIAVLHLAESGDPQFIPTFSRFADRKFPYDVVSISLYGLAVHSNSKDAASALRKFAASRDHRFDHSLATALLKANSTSSRSILVDFDHNAGVQPATKALIRNALRRAPDNVRAPYACPSEQRHDFGGVGPVTCIDAH